MPKDNEVDEKVEHWDYCRDLRIAVTDGKNGARATLNGHGAPAGISLYHGDYVAELKAEAAASAATVAELRAEVESLREILIATTNPDSSPNLLATQVGAAETYRLAAINANRRADAAERRVGECLKFIDGIRDELHNRRTADWYPEGAHNAAAQMSEDMRLLGNACADFDPYTLTGADPT